MSTDQNAPQWKPVPNMEQYADARTQRNRAATATDQGRIKRAPALGYEYWMKPSGNIVRLVVHSTRDIKGAVNLNSYADTTRRKSLRRDWLPWGYNDACKYIPQIVGDRTEKQWDSYRETLRQERIKAHRERASQYDRAWKERLEIQKENTQQAMTAALGDLVTMMRGEGQKPAGKAS